eukprot:TRINITY_DN10066_c0_g1_i5.p2 TRINITY_DN10066_c0_g1~~TRINITY_DN10066_c0_g1_i5.p2  ORF type:complete len:255 (-),score=11.75 TRINITY_DN10066_c0_g1_i5:169-933(-)
MAILPETTALYCSAEYWDSRFKEEDQREWCQQYEDFKYLLEPHLQPDFIILIVGCGNSNLGKQLVEAGYPHVVNCDISPNVLHKMNLRMRRDINSTQQMDWICCDMLQLPFRYNWFDIIIEKGTLDVWFTESSAWNVTLKAEQRMQRTLDNIFSMLKIGGKFVSITFTDPYFRMKYYQNQRYGWNCVCERFGNDFHYYFYTMVKLNQSLNKQVTLEFQGMQQQVVRKQHQGVSPVHEYMDSEDYILRVMDGLID